jgi:proline iminopeptidase
MVSKISYFLSLTTALRCEAIDDAGNSMQALYPAIKPNQSSYLAVGDDDTHQLYIEESGTVDGIPVLFLHGGPGAGCSDQDRRFFDPEKYRIILFDQRGSGLSRPHVELKNNTTTHLIDDIEKIREYLDIDQWMLFGGSWGATLALLYAQTFTDRVLGMVLRGVFLCRPADLRWLYQEGASRVYPDYWEKFIAPVKLTPDAINRSIASADHDSTIDPALSKDTASERAIACPPSIIDAYYRLLTSSNELQKMHAAKQWSLWETRCATLRPHLDMEKASANPHVALSLARIEAHYFVNHGFINDNQILGAIDVLAEIPTIIIHGRYDMICPLENAFTLQRCWPKAQLRIIRDAGHSSREAGITDALVKATDEMVSLLSVDLAV